MTPTEKHRAAARDIAFDFDCDWTADGRRRGEREEQDAVEAIARALAAAEAEASANLISIIADIRQKSGIGGKPMLGELAEAIAEKIKDARREIAKRAAEIALREGDRHMPALGYVISQAILAEAGEDAP